MLGDKVHEEQLVNEKHTVLLGEEVLLYCLSRVVVVTVGIVLSELVFQGDWISLAECHISEPTPSKKKLIANSL